MKKIILIAACAASLSTYALPTYEPFSEPLFVNAIAATGSNAVDLATSGLTAPTGELWGNMSWSGTFGTGLHGFDILVTNNPALFTASALSTILPSHFPGMPASGQSITNILMNPAQPLVAGAESPNIIGNSAVLIFNKDIKPPTSGSSTLYISYLFNVAQKGALGTGNDGRYLAFVAQSNTVEGASVGYYNTWTSMLDEFTGGTSGPGIGTAPYAAHALRQDGTPTYYVGAADSYGPGESFTSTPFVETFSSSVVFVVGAINIGPNGAYTNSMWVNPSLGSFGGANPPASPIFNDIVTATGPAALLSDIGGMVVEDRPGSGAHAGGVGSNYMANILIGTTWSYVTGGPEFTSQPAAFNGPPNSTATLSAAAVAGGQTVAYQWQHISGGVTNNVSNGSGGAGGGAVVSGATNATLTLTGLTYNDAGSYQLVATASSTLYSLTNSPVAVTVSDPAVITPPQPATANYARTATLSATVETATSGMTYAWYDGSTRIANGPQPDGSYAIGADGSAAGGTVTLTLTLTNVSYLDDGSYSLVVTNANNAVTTSASAALTVNDPAIYVQPAASVEVALNGTVTIPVSANGSGATYQWYDASSGQLSNSGDDSGVTTTNLTISGAQLSDAGTYYLTITGSGGTVQSSNSVLYVDTPYNVESVSPAVLVQQVGTHFALLCSATGGTGLVHFRWQRNGLNLTNGPQADGSAISGVTSNILVVSNAQVGDTGTYNATAYNNAATNNASSSVTIVTGLQRLSTNNLVVARIGDGAEPLSSAMGNTVYLDQVSPASGYSNTIMVPDNVRSTALIVPGGSPEAPLGLVITKSLNSNYLNFCGFNATYPLTGPQTFAGLGIPRAVGAVNALGYFQLAQTNNTLYDGGAAGDDLFNCVMSLDGFNQFWTAGYATAPPGLKYETTTVIYSGGANTSIAGSAIGTRAIAIAGGDLVYSDAGSSPAGIYYFSGEPTAAATAYDIVSDAAGNPEDFALSPDNPSLTYYVCDSSSIASGGGIQRYDWNGSIFALSYTLGTGPGSTVGASCLTVDFSASASWGQGVTGAIIYATTAGASNNTLIKFVDNGAGSDASAIVLEQANANQILRGVRFGPTPLPVSIVVGPQGVNTFIGQSDDLTVSATGDGPLSYQWQFDGTNISGATSTNLLLSNLQATNSGTYTVVVFNALSTNSSSAVVSVTSGPPVVLAPVQSRVETVGDHLAFAISVNGTLPITYQWLSNGVAIAGATNTSFGLQNIVLADSATYSVVYGNLFGTNTNSATLLVTTGLQPLSSNNLVVSRVGDGLEALSSSTGNTVYLDQFTTSGVYSNTIMIQDSVLSNALIVPGGTPEAALGSVLTKSVNNIFLNYGGFNSTYPATLSFTGENIPRATGAVNAFGYAEVVQTDVTLYDSSGAGADLYNSAVSVDGYNDFWTTGFASAPPGLKYTGATGSVNAALGGSASATRVVQIVGGNIAFTDAGSLPAGLSAFQGEPTATATSSVIITNAAGNPADFAASPDTTSYPPSSSTVYLCDTSATTSGGGIQRYDWNGSAYTLSYTLGTGASSTAGASCLTVDFSASANWGLGVTGAVIYATTTGNPGNSLIKIVDNGSGSGASATVIEAANQNQILRGVRFGPVAAAPIIVSNPSSQNVFVGKNAVFSVATQNGPITNYEWFVNGTPLANGLGGDPVDPSATVSGAQSATLTVSNITGLSDLSQFSVQVENPYPTPVMSSSATLTVPANITSFPPVLEDITTGSSTVLTVGATGGDATQPLTYQWVGPCGNLSDGPNSCNGSTATVTGSQTASLTLSGLSTNDDGSYYVVVSANENGTQTNNQTRPTVLSVVSQPKFSAISSPSSGTVQLNVQGTAGSSYRVWATTNLALSPVTSKWTPVYTNTFSGGIDTIPITTTNIYQFYVITQP